MTVTTLNNKDFGTGDGVMTVFPFTFRLQQASDLKVYVSGALVLTGYTVAINASGVGGNVTFTVAPANLAPIVFVRLVTLTQQLSLPVEANFSEVDITNALDKLTMEVQQNAEAIGRSITLPITSSISGLTLPNPSALKVLRWNATADALENTDINVTGGGILGPGTSNANRPVLWNATNGSLVKNATNDNGTAGFVWTSNGPTAEPTFQAPANTNAPIVNGGRITVVNGDPFGTGSAAANIYWNRYLNDQISLWDGANYQLVSTGADILLALAGVASGTLYDVFGYLNAGTLKLEVLAWSSGTARATAVVRDANGVWTKSGDRTKRLLATVLGSGVNRVTHLPSGGVFGVDNVDNAIPQSAKAVDTTNTWTYALAAYRSFNNSTVDGVGRITFVTAIADDIVRARVTGIKVASGDRMAVGVGLDSTTVNSAQIKTANFMGNFTDVNADYAQAEYNGIPAVGLHRIYPLESSPAATSVTFAGDNGGTEIQTGMTFEKAA